MGTVVGFTPKTLGPNLAQVAEIPLDDQPTITLCYEPVDPTPRWLCNCGNDVFFVTPYGVVCPHCGCYTKDPYEEGY
jgi:hypothetical protein